MDSLGLQFCLAALVFFVFGIGLFLLGWISDGKRRKINRFGEETTAKARQTHE